jgi:anti-sigma factor RsiW
MTCQQTIDVAAYLLDALDADEADRLSVHLADCADCRREYDELSGLPVLLGSLTPADVEDVVAPAELPDTLCDALLAEAAQRRRRRTRHHLLGVAAAVVVTVACVVAGVTGTGGHPQPAAVTVSATNPATHVHANATLMPREWGTEVHLQLSGITWAQHCVLVVSSAAGQRDTAASWVANYQGDLDIDGTTAIPTGQITHLDVVTTAGRLLLRVPAPR